MAITVETGTGSATADSYISVSDADAIIATSSYATAWALLGTGAKENALKKATQKIDNDYRFYGQALTTTQALQWPRTKNIDYRGITLAPGTIPTELKRAVSLMGAILETEDAPATVEEVSSRGPVKSWSGDGLSMSWGTSGSAASDKNGGLSYLLGTRYPELELALRAIGTLKDVDWLQTNKISVVRK